MPTLIPGAFRRVLDLFVLPEKAYDPQRGNVDLSQTQLGPGQPIQSTPLTGDTGPRQYQYPVGLNLSLTPRRENPALNLAPFEQLRMLANMYSTAANCIALTIEEAQGVKWSVRAKDKRQQAGRQGQCDVVMDLLNKPDGVTFFHDWLAIILREILEVDALALYKQRDMTGRIIRLDYVDGTTIKPLLDERGRTAGYQQILYGYPRSQFDRPDTPGTLGPWPADGDLIYRPRWPSVNSPYGRPPMERVMLEVNMALRKITADLSHFTDGNVPAGVASPPEGVQMQPDQVRAFEEAFNADLQGDDRARARIKFFAWAANFQQFDPFQHNVTLDQWLQRQTCFAFGITPSELGDTGDVNKASAGHQENLAYRRRIGPLFLWLKLGLFDPFIQNDLGYKELEWTPEYGEVEDKTATAQTDQIYYNVGSISSQELRSLRFPDLEGRAPGPPQQNAAGAGIPNGIPTAVAKRKRSRRREKIDAMLDDVGPDASAWAIKVLGE